MTTKKPLPGLVEAKKRVLCYFWPFLTKKAGVNSKRGGMLDFFYIIAAIFIGAVALLVSFMVVHVANQTNIFSSDATAQAAVDSSENTLLNFDNMMLFVIVGLSVFVLVSSAVVYHHPAFFIVSAIMLMIAVTVAAIASNTFWTFSNQPSMLATTAMYPKTSFLMNHLPHYIAFMGIASTIAMFISFRRE